VCGGVGGLGERAPGLRRVPPAAYRRTLGESRGGAGMRQSPHIFTERWLVVSLHFSLCREVCVSGVLIRQNKHVRVYNISQ
jgi:hypothetical protein